MAAGGGSCDNAAVTAPCARAACACVFALVAPLADACDADSNALFRCEASNGRKFIELCAPSPLDAQSGYLVYRFGSPGKDGAERAVELEYPGLVPCDAETPVGRACVK